MSKIPEPARTELINGLSHAYGRAALELDGHEVTFRVERYKALRYCIVPFVNGVFHGAWATDRPGREAVPDTDLARRVMRKRISRLYPPAKLKAVNRSRRAIGLEPMTKERNETIYWDTWHCPRQLVAQIERQFEGILILEAGHASA